MPEEQLAKLTAYDSIDALAEGIGVDKDRLTKTIKNYNSFANNGRPCSQQRHDFCCHMDPDLL